MKILSCRSSLEALSECLQNENVLQRMEPNIGARKI